MTVRSMSRPRPGWSLPDAVRLAEQGYSLEQVERLTGYAAAHVKAQLAPHPADVARDCARVPLPDEPESSGLVWTSLPGEPADLSESLQPRAG